MTQVQIVQLDWEKSGAEAVAMVSISTEEAVGRRIRDLYNAGCYVGTARYTTGLESLTNQQLCDEAFARFNRGSGREDPLIDILGLRSLSIGDLVVLDQHAAYLCINIGWLPFTLPRMLVECDLCMWAGPETDTDPSDLTPLERHLYNQHAAPLLQQITTVIPSPRIAAAEKVAEQPRNRFAITVELAGDALYKTEFYTTPQGTRTWNTYSEAAAVAGGLIRQSVAGVEIVPAPRPRP